MDDIGMFMGKNISEMTRDELLDFARYAGKELWRLGKIEREASDFLINKEIAAKQP